MSSPHLTVRSAAAWLVTAAVLALALLIGVSLLGGPGHRPLPAAAPSPAPTPSQSPNAEPGYRLRLTLGRVLGRGIGGRAHAGDLAEAARAVERTMTDLYSAGFVDPTAWHDGTFPGIYRLFAGSARAEAHTDLRGLTLGHVAVALDAVQPREARLNVRFLTDAADRPSTAFADMRFEGTALSGTTETRVRQQGDFTLRRVDGVWRIVSYDVRSHVPSAFDIERKVEEARGMPSLPSRDPLFFLVIGSDARPGQSIGGSRGDSLHIVAVDPRTGAASILGIPRDSFVPVPGAGTTKINEALVRGGPELAVKTVEQLSGVHIDAYVLTGFQGFEHIVRTVGAISITIPYDISDHFSHAFFQRGPTELNPREALAFVRNRHDAPGGDFGRSLNQGRFLIAALAELRDGLRTDPSAIIPWIVAGARYVQTDLSVPQMIDLILAAPVIDPARIVNRVVPGSTATIGGRSVVLLGASAREMFHDLARDGTLGR
jgi:LCP family protein required for cell wall assembly